MTELYSMSEVEMQKIANVVFVSVIKSAHKEGFISKEDSETLLSHYSVIMENVSWMPDFLARWLKLGKGTSRFRLVRAIGRDENA